MDQLIHQVKTRVIPIFDLLHPESQALFVFNCSAAHEAFEPNALRANNINLGSRGKKNNLRDTFIPTDESNIPEELRGLPQFMVFPPDYLDQNLAGKAKGVQVVLEALGLWSIQKIQANGKTVFKCCNCKKSGVARDAKDRAYWLMKEAKGVGFFITKPWQELSVNEEANPMCCA